MVLLIRKHKSQISGTASMNTITKQASRDILDKQIIGLNSLGLPLRTIGEKIGFHPTTVTQRLDALGVERADTRHAFMADIYDNLNESQKAWLMSEVSEHSNIKNYVQHLLLRAYHQSQGAPN